MIPNNADSEYIKTLLKEITFLKQKNLALEEELDRYKNRNSRFLHPIGFVASFTSEPTRALRERMRMQLIV